MEFFIKILSSRSSYNSSSTEIISEEKLYQSLTWLDLEQFYKIMILIRCMVDFYDNVSIYSKSSDCIWNNKKMFIRFCGYLCNSQCVAWNWIHCCQLCPIWVKASFSVLELIFCEYLTGGWCCQLFCNISQFGYTQSLWPGPPGCEQYINIKSSPLT